MNPNAPLLCWVADATLCLKRTLRVRWDSFARTLRCASAALKSS